MAERRVFELDVQTGESGKRVKDVDQKLTDLRAELTKALAALKDFKNANKDTKGLVEQSAAFQQLEGKVKGIRSEYNRLQNEQQGVRANTGGLTNAIGTVALKLTAGIAAFQGITSTVAGSVEAYGASEAAQKRLQVALGRTSEALLTQATALSQKTKFDDDAIVSAQALLAVQKLSEDQIKALTPAILDLAEAQGVDLETATQAVAVSIVNGSDKLKKYGIDLDGAAGSNERVADAVAKLNDRFGQQAEQAALIGSGPLKVMQNQLGNLQEAMGGLVISAVSPFLGGLTDMANGLTALLAPSQSAVDAFREQRSAVADLTTNVSPLLDRYDELAGKTELTADEQGELKTVVDQVAKAVPLAVAEFDEYGKALRLNTTAAREYITEQKNVLLLRNKDAIKENSNNLKTYQGELNRTKDFLNRTTDAVVVNGKEYIRQGNVLKEITRGLSDRSPDRERILDLTETNKIIQQVTESYQKYATNVSGLKGELADLTGEKSEAQLAAEASQADSAAAAQRGLEDAYASQTATLEQLGQKKKQLEDDRDKLKESDLEKIALKNAEIEVIEKRIKVFAKEVEAKKEAKLTDRQTFDQNSKALDEELKKELAVIQTQQDEVVITTQQAELRRLDVQKDAAQKRVELVTEFASKGGFTVDEIANIAALQTNADQAEKLYNEFLSKLEQDKNKAENIAAFVFDQSHLKEQLEQDLAAFDAYSQAKAQEEESLGLSEHERNERQKERDAERLKILKTGNAAVLQSQLDFITAQVAVLEKLQSSGKPFTDDQKKQLDGLLAQARELKTQLLLIANTAAPEEGPTSFLAGLFDITDEQAENITNKAIAFAQQLGQSLVGLAQQHNSQLLADTTARAESEYNVNVDSLRAQQQAGLITQAEFDERRKKLEDAKNARLLAAKVKEFKANQKLALAEVAINTAVAITAAIRRPGTPFDKAAEAVLYAATGVLEAIVIKQQEPPQFARGGSVPNTPYTFTKATGISLFDDDDEGTDASRGGLAVGPRHGPPGGIPFKVGDRPFQMEGGEFIVRREAAQRWLPQLQFLNSHFAEGGRVPPIPKVAAFDQSVSESRSAINKNTAPTEIRAYVVESDITNAQRTATRYDSKAEIG